MSNINVNNITPDSGELVSVSGSFRIGKYSVSRSLYVPNMSIDNNGKHVTYNSGSGLFTYTTGSFGATGAKGVQGQKGAIGTKGQKGAIGGDGVQGLKGQKGAIGIKGEKGGKGQKGVIGNTGLLNTTGTPVNNQVGVWTSATSMEGEEKLTFAGSTLLVQGIVSSSIVRVGSTTILDPLPTSDPGVPGRVWRSGTDLKISI